MHRSARPHRLLFKLVTIGIAGLLLATAHAGGDLNTIQARGVLRCGVSDDIPGFSERNSAGRWQGMNVDYCRALAAAILASPDKVEFVALKASQRFPALQSKAVDILVRNTTWTLSREVLLKFQFPGILYYDGQGFMVSKSSRITSLDKLEGATVCVEKGTTHESHLTEYMKLRGINVIPLIIDSAREAAEALYAGRCSAYTSDASQLAALRTRAPGQGKNYAILPERISKEPMGPVIRRGDPELDSLVRWVLNILVAAEEKGVTRDNVEAKFKEMQTRSHTWKLLTGQEEWVARALGVRGDWALRALRAVGNYGEIFERNLGSAALNIDRGYNRLWQQGGLMYAPPID